MASSGAAFNDSLTPTFRAQLGEARVFGEWLAGRVQRRRLVAGRDGDGRAVMVIPGFLSRDALTRPLRDTLTAANYHVEGWGLGFNRGVTPDLLDRLCERIRQVSADHGPVALVGWSLGGLYAREAAKIAADDVSQVITLGTPFSGDPRANRAWKLYERLNGHPVDKPPVQVTVGEKPPVPTIALWSPRDGIVAPACSRGLTGEADLTARVHCSHNGFVRAPAALEAVLDALECWSAGSSERDDSAPA